MSVALEVMDGGQAATLTGVGCMGYFIRADGVTVPAEGTVSGNVAMVTLPADCYAVQGRCRLSVNLVKGSDIHTMLQVDGYVDRTRTDTVTDPENVIPSVDELLAKIATMDVATAAAKAAAEKAEAAADGVGTGTPGTASAPMVYCWGDSLTEGVGGWDDDQFITSAYPDALRFPHVNLGCRGEDIQTIMARQGADPIVLTEAIPSLPARMKPYRLAP